MIDVIVLFTGLLGFVPDQPLVEGEENAFHVFAVHGDYIYPKHATTVIIREKFFDGIPPEWCRPIEHQGCMNPPCKQHPKGERYFRCDLNEEEYIEFEPKKQKCKNKKLCVEIEYGEDIELGACPTEKNRHDLGWVAGMHEITRGLGEVHPSILVLPGRVKAHFVLRQGELRTLDFARWNPDDLKAAVRALGGEQQGRQLAQLLTAVQGQQASDSGKVGPILGWEIDRPGTDFVQALADLVDFRTKISEPLLEIKLRGKAIRNINLNKYESPIYIEIKNVVSDHLCDDLPATPELPKDHHFSYLHNLLAQHPGLEGLEFEFFCPLDKGILKALPEEEDYRLCSPPWSKLNDPQCPGARFEPN